MDGCCLLNIKWSSAAMIDFELDSLMTLFFFHFLREFVCCLYKVVGNRKSRAHIFFFLIWWRPWKSHKMRSLRAEFYSDRPDWFHLRFFNAGRNESSFMMPLAFHRRPAAFNWRWSTSCPSVRPLMRNKTTFRVFVSEYFEFCFLCVRMRCISTSMNVTPSNFLSSDDCRARNFCRLPNRDGRWRRRRLNEAIGNHETDREDSRSKKDEKALPFCSDRPLRIFFSNRRTRSMQMNDVDDDEPWSRSSRLSLAFHSINTGRMTEAYNNNNNRKQVRHR